MNLEDFVFESITQIARGIERAQKEAADRYLVSPLHKGESRVYKKALIKGELETVHFDVAITSESKGKGGGELSVVGLHIGSGHEKTSLDVSRVQFDVKVQWPPLQS